MATTTYGTEYVQSSDLVSNWPGSSLNVANRIDDVSLKGNGLNNQTGTSYTLVLTDGGKNVTLNNASAVSLTVPTNASVAFPTGTGIGLVNKGAGVVTVDGAGGVTVSGASLTLSQNETAVLIKLDTNAWVMSKGGGIPKASYSSSTGSPSVDTTTRPGKTVVYWTGHGTVVVGQGGTVEILVYAGGGSGGGDNGGGGGGGGHLYEASAYLAAGTHTVKVGAGGATTQYQGLAGNGSRLGPYYALGGGGGGSNIQTYVISGGTGGSGGGSTRASTAGGLGMDGQGNDGGVGAATLGGGGGGAGGAGGAGATTANAGAGLANSITGASVTRCAGGDGDRNNNTATNGGANTGNGGKGTDGGGINTGTGGSGGVILVFG